MVEILQCLYDTLRPLEVSTLFKGDLELARVLLARGADVNWREDWSGLHYAASGDHGDLLALLLAQHGVEVNIEDSERVTPLMVACHNGRENIVRKLLQADGIDINRPDESGNTALHHAVGNFNPGCVKLLREVPGLEWNLKDFDDEYTPLLMATIYGTADSLEIILDVPQPQLDLAATDALGYNVAWCAVLNTEDCGDQQRCVQLLCDDPRVDWNTRDLATGNTPLLACLEEGKLEVAKILLSNPRVDLNIQNNAGEFPETIAR